MSYRTWIVATALGLISYHVNGASYAQDPQPTKQVENSSAMPDLAFHPAVSLEHSDEGCDQGKDNRKSDLCAQWKAADAAEKSAEIAWWQSWIGSIIGVLTFLAACAAANFARIAAKHTGETVSATRDVSKDQTRAYVHMDKAEMTWGNDNGTAPRIILTAVNSGQTPAKWFEIKQICYTFRLPDRPDEEILHSLDGKPWTRYNAFPAGSSQTFSGIQSKRESEEISSIYGDVKSVISIFGTIRYATFFNEVFESDFIFRRAGVPKYRELSREFLRKDSHGPGVLVDVFETTERPHAIPKSPHLGIRAYQLIRE